MLFCPGRQRPKACDMGKGETHVSELRAFECSLAANRGGRWVYQNVEYGAKALDFPLTVWDSILAFFFTGLVCYLGLSIRQWPDSHASSELAVYKVGSNRIEKPGRDRVKSRRYAPVRCHQSHGKMRMKKRTMSGGPFVNPASTTLYAMPCLPARSKKEAAEENQNMRGWGVLAGACQTHR